MQLAFMVKKCDASCTRFSHVEVGKSFHRVNYSVRPFMLLNKSYSCMITADSGLHTFPAFELICTICTLHGIQERQSCDQDPVCHGNKINTQIFYESNNKCSNSSSSRCAIIARAKSQLHQRHTDLISLKTNNESSIVTTSCVKKVR